MEKNVLPNNLIVSTIKRQNELQKYNRTNRDIDKTYMGNGIVEFITGVCCGIILFFFIKFINDKLYY